jgi:hypothetical protein
MILLRMMIMLTIMKTLKMNSRRIQLSNGLGENDDHTEACRYHPKIRKYEIRKYGNTEI